MKKNIRTNLPLTLLLSLKEVNLSVRAINCLHAYDLDYLWLIVKSKKSDLMKFRNMGEITVNEITKLIKSLNLKFEMEFSGEEIDFMKSKTLDIEPDWKKALRGNR